MGQPKLSIGLDRPAVVGATDDRPICRGSNLLKDLVDVTLAIKDMNQPGRLAGLVLTLKGCPGSDYTLQPLVALLVLYPTLSSVFGLMGHFGPPAPSLLVDQPQNQPRFIQGQNRMIEHPPGLGRVVDGPQTLGLPGAVKNQGSGVLDGYNHLLRNTSTDRGFMDGGLQGFDADPLVLDKAVGRLGLTPIRKGLIETILGALGQNCGYISAAILQTGVRKIKS